MDIFRRIESASESGETGARVPIYECTPDCIAASQMTAFTVALEEHTGRVFPDYAALHDFSVREYQTFWRYFVQWAGGLDWSGDAEPVCVGEDCEHARFFPNLELNYANDVLGLSVAGADAPAVIGCHADGRRVRLSRGELRDRVARLAHALLELGLREGDRVVGVMRNDSEAIVAALAVTAIGATLSTAAPEMGVETILDRFAPLAPRLLFAHTVARAFDRGAPLAGKIATLALALPTVQSVVCLDEGHLPDAIGQPVYSVGALIDGTDATRFVWRRFPFNHPLFVMFSSGTTGKPKCIVHGTGGTLLEHLKEHRLHCDLRPGDRMFFHTSCSWMMWNWQLSALASGVEIVTYDGPIASVDTLWRLVASERVTVFGTSPAYLKMSEESGLIPGSQFDLSALRAMLSTGAVLFDSQFDWVRDHVKPLPLQSISGGTDILGCFVLGNPNLPVYAGEAQCKSLALDVQSWTDGAHADGVGQLVCVNPFPSRPIGFFGDTDSAAFHAAYFAANPGVWTHGDIIEFLPQGSARLHGRSDGVLNVRGINVGPGEIYRVLNDIPGIHEAMVVEQRLRETPTGDSSTHGERFEQRVVLLLVLQEGVALTGALTAQVRRDLARRASAAHVPDRIIAVDSLPVTHNGKLSEAAARNAVNGLPVFNTAALRNPECLDAIRNHPALNHATRELPSAGASRQQLEQRLQAQWENLLGFGPINRDDNFFELGGHSLLGVRLLSELSTLTGRTIPLATLLTASTIARLAEVIDDSALPSSSPVLVPVRNGVGNALFLMHSLSGSVMECWALVAALRTSRPVYGLQAIGLDGDEPVQKRVEDMARGYIEQMRTVQPRGPYALAGYSFGGLVALEVAQQLLRAGEQVEVLCLLDTYVNERCLPWSAWIRYQCRYMAGHGRTLRELPASQRLRYLTTKFVGALDRVRMRAGRLALRADPNTEGMPPTLRRVRASLRAAMIAYRPLPYRASPIVYLRAVIPERELGDPLPLWKRVARAGLVVVQVPGGHPDMITEPNVQTVAAALDHALTQV
jgi:acetoacetyl-CoA synthetase